MQGVGCRVPGFGNCLLLGRVSRIRVCRLLRLLLLLLLRLLVWGEGSELRVWSLGFRV